MPANKGATTCADVGVFKEAVFETDQTTSNMNTMMQECDNTEDPEDINPDYPCEFLELPKDEDGFVQAFDITQEKELMEFWNKYGIVVVKNMLDEENIQKTIDEIWTDPELLGQNGTKSSIKRDDPSTWENNKWPTQMGLIQGGFISHFADVDFQQSWNNRSNPNIYKLFTLLFNRKDLWVTFDRYGMMRPTKNIQLLDGTVVDKPEWKSQSNWLHWDQNPWNNPDFMGIQGLVALSDSKGNTGGFHCVPGFTHAFKQWSQLNEHRKKKGGLVNVPQNDKMRQHVQRISLRKGSFLAWDSRIAHGNYPNESNTFRIVQYIAFIPAEDKGNDTRQRRLEAFFQRSLSKKYYRAAPQLNEHGEYILGLRDWKTGEKIAYPT